MTTLIPNRGELCRDHKMFGLLGLLLVLSGCANLPDTQPFTEGTISLRSAVASSGAAVVSELERTPLEGVNAQAKNLATAWEERNKLFSALVEYANSLQGIVDAGNKGEESANALAASVSQLARAANLVEPGAGEAAAAVTEAAAFVYTHIARARAAHSLEKALAEVQPAIERISATMAAQMQSLDDLIRTASKAQRDELRISKQAEVAYRESLLASRQRILNQLRTDLNAGRKATELAGADELKRLDELIEGAEGWNEPLQNQLQEIATREQLSRQLIGETKSALADWAAAHARMLAAVRTKRIPTATELVQAAERIRELVEKFRNL